MINMKNIYRSFAAIALVGCMTLAGCSNDDIIVDPETSGIFDVADIPVALTVNENNKAKNQFIEFRDEASTELFLTTAKEVKAEVESQFYYNIDILTKYNFEKGTKYVAFPEDLVTLSNDGVVKFDVDSKKSTALSIVVKSSEALKADITYVLPVSAKLVSEDNFDENTLKVGKSADYFIFIRDLSSIPDATKPPYVDADGNVTPAVKVISCMEVNDTNPLNNLCFTLKNSGKPLIDIVILFSGNINYNAETGRVYNHNNPNVQHLLDNRDKYLKPLQDRGIKVVLGILGNHDSAGVNTLADETARAFVQELKAVCDAYNLDGIFWDDEYTKLAYDIPGFQSGNCSRLIYETKKAMPDKLNCVYAYSSTYELSPVDGILPGDYIDWAIDDYGGYASGKYPGITKGQWAVQSQEYNLGRNLMTSVSSFTSIRKEGWGGNMIFAMDPNRANSQRQIESMQAMAKGFYDDELVVEKPFYKKDW